MSGLFCADGMWAKPEVFTTTNIIVLLLMITTTVIIEFFVMKFVLKRSNKRTMTAVILANFLSYLTGAIIVKILWEQQITFLEEGIFGAMIVSILAGFVACAYLRPERGHKK